MKRFAIFRSLFLPAIAAVLMLAGAAPASAQERFDHSRFNGVLQKYVNDRGYVDYAALKGNRADLDAYIAQMERVSPESKPALFPDRASKLAYWMNAYNAFTLKGVIEKYPKHDLTGLLSRYRFFLRTKHTIGGRRMSLDTLEHKIIREQFGEPRIHFAIVCASEGCPRLLNEAFTAERLEEQLDRQARRFINEDRSVKLDAAKNRVYLSKIFDWFKDDFTKTLPAGQKDATEYLKPYLTPERRQAFEQLRAPRIEYIDYDWRINDQARSDVVKK
jgi:hypothetical protein